MAQPTAPANSDAQQGALEIVRKLQSHGYIAYWAGGCVRDRIMQRPPHDYDVATSATPPQVLALFRRARKVGIAFGVVLVQMGDISIEVATFRRDGDYSDGRRPDEVIFADPQADAQRRDFTCNGLFYDPLADTVIDYVAGQRDIQARILRCIGTPAQRFAEDYLRLLRAARFAAKLDFAIAPETAVAVRTFAPRLTGISLERITMEVQAMLEHPSRLRALYWLEQLELLRYCFPLDLLTASRGCAWPRVQRLPETAPLPVVLIAMWLDLTHGEVGDHVTLLAQFRRQLCLSNELNDQVVFLLTQLDAGRHFLTLRLCRQKRLLAQPYWPLLAMLLAADLPPELWLVTHTRVRELFSGEVSPIPFVNGHDLQQLGAAPGPVFKAWLDGLYDQQLEGVFADRFAALHAAQQLLANSPTKTPPL